MAPRPQLHPSEPSAFWRRFCTLALSAALAGPASLSAAADDVDPRLKAVEEQLERDAKPADQDEAKAKAALLAAHAKYCKAKAAACQKAVQTLARKAKTAKDAGDAKGAEVYQARLDELKADAETWEKASAAKLAVRFEEDDAPEAKPADAKDAKDAKAAVRLPGAWMLTKAGDKFYYNVKIAADGSIDWPGHGACKFAPAAPGGRMFRVAVDGRPKFFVADDQGRLVQCGPKGQPMEAGDVLTPSK